jgi:hypothetical protein
MPESGLENLQLDPRTVPLTSFTSLVELDHRVCSAVTVWVRQQCSLGSKKQTQRLAVSMPVEISIIIQKRRRGTALSLSPSVSMAFIHYIPVWRFQVACSSSQLFLHCLRISRLRQVVAATLEAIHLKKVREVGAAVSGSQ